MPHDAIGTESKLDVSAAVRAFPQPIAGTEVRYCGFAAETSYGASSYLVVRPEGNVLVDSPRAARPLIDRIEALGGVHTMVLSHRDDVADHATYARRFGSIRVMHAADIDRATRGIERVIEGDEAVALAPDLLVIPVPGHTQGSVAVLYRNFLFYGRPPLGQRGQRVLGGLTRGVLVLVGRADALNAPAPLLRLHLGAAGARPAPPCRAASHAPKARGAPLADGAGASARYLNDTERLLARPVRGRLRGTPS